MKVTQKSEDYLKWIFILSKSHEVHSIEIAKELGVSRATVSITLKKLEENGYIKMDVDKAIFLTEEGENIAKEIYEKNIVLCSFLLNLGIDEKTAKRDACRLEHAISSESFEIFKKAYLNDGVENQNDSYARGKEDIR